MANGIQKDLGKVTAYSYAKAAGYTGTEEQFQAIFNEFTENAPGLIDRMDTAVARAEAAVTTIDSTVQTAVDEAVDEATADTLAIANQAVSDAQAAQTAAEGAVTQANNAVTQANAAVTAAQAAQSAAEDAAESFVIDDTLTVSGAAADAKKTGDEFADVKNNIATLDGYFSHSKNEANPETISANTVISSSGVVNSSTQTDTSDYIFVKGGNYYSWKNLSYVARYNSSKGWIGRTSGTSQNKLWFANDGYVRLCGATGTADRWRFNVGETVVDEQYYKNALSEDVILLTQLDGVEAEIKEINDIAVPTYGVPFSPAIPYHYTGESITPYKTSGHLQDIYDLFDSLVEDYPDYVTKTVLGKDASNTYDLNLYTISNGTNYAHRLPRFVWISNIHGNEGNSSISAYYFAKELLSKFTTDPCCYSILSAYTVYIIPCANPWGVENYSRLNSNNVNLNRNFPADWVYRDPDLTYGTSKYGIESASNGTNQYYYYGGGSVTYNDSTQTATTTYTAEAETTLIMNFINYINTGNNLNGKIAFAVNKHDSGTMSEEGATILIKDNYKSDRTFIKNLTDWLKPLLMGTQNWLTKKSGLNMATVTYSLHNDSDAAGTMDKWFNARGIHGCLCEIPKSAGSTYTDTEHFSDLCAINVDFAINLIANTIVNNARLKNNTQTETYTIVN